MSDMSGGQIVGGIIGGVVGFIYGGPIGAVQGFALGSGIGGYIDPPPGPNLKGPTLDDKSFQSSAYGVSLPRLYGTIATMGNIIYLENNEYKAVSKKEQQGGKGGGGGGTLTTTTYYATFAIALAEAIPGSLPRRIWAGGKLIYSAGVDDFGSIAQSNREVGIYDKITGAASVVNPGWKYYDGSQTEPDSRMEAALGVGNCPSYEGTAFIIFYDFELTNYGNGLAGCPIKVEISCAGDLATENKFKLIKYVDVTQNIPGGINETGSCNPGDSNFVASLYMSTWPPFANDKYGSVYSTSGQYDVVQEPSNAEPGTGGRPIFGNSDSSKFWMKYTYRIPPSGFADSVTNGSSVYEFPNGYYVRRVYESKGMGAYFDTNTNVHGEYVITSGDLSSAVEYNGELVAIGDDCLCLFKDDGIYVYGSGLSLDRIIDCEFSGAMTSSYAAAIFLNKIYVAYNLPSFDDELIFRVIDMTDGGWSEYTASIPGDIYRYPSGFRPTMIVRDGVICLGDVFGPDGSNPRFGFMYFNIKGTLAHDGVARANLADVVDDIVLRSGIESSELNVSELEDYYVDGYRFNGDNSLRSALSPLQVAYLFDIYENGYSIVAKVRGNVPSVVILHHNLMMEGSKIVESSAELSSTFPSRYNINYMDYNREYDTSTQYADYPSNFQNVRTEDLPVVMTANAAATLSERLINASWIERFNYSFKLPQIFLDLKVSDCITVELSPNRLVDVRINSITESGNVLSVSAKASSYLAYQLEAVGQDVDPPDETISFVGETLSVLMDIPLMHSAMDVYGFVAGMYTAEQWPGASLMRSVDSGQTYSGIQYFDGKTTIANCSSSLPANSGFIIDYSSELTAVVVSGQFESVSEFQMMTGKNFAAYGVDGRWEILQFINADLQTDGSIIFSGFVRGMRGTEWATGLHQLGDLFVLLEDPDNLFVGDDFSSVNIPRLYKSVTVGGMVNSAAAKSFTYKGVNLKPLSPVNAAGSRAANDLTITWSPRSRYQSSYWYSGVLAQNEPVMSWAVDVMSGSNVVRTITSSTASVVYTAAQQAADFGSAQSSVAVKIYQISSRVGRGYPLGVTL